MIKLTSRKIFTQLSYLPISVGGVLCTREKRGTSPGGHYWNHWPCTLSFNKSYCDSFEDYVPVYEICQYLIFKQVVVTEKNDRVPGHISRNGHQVSCPMDCGTTPYCTSFYIFIYIHTTQKLTLSLRRLINQEGILPWWSSLGLLSWYPIF